MKHKMQMMAEVSLDVIAKDIAEEMKLPSKDLAAFVLKVLKNDEEAAEIVMLALQKRYGDA